MGLIDLQTDLKSLKFGKDRFGGGDSGQPYIKTPIITEPGKLSQSDDDFILRGGSKAPIRALEDVARLTKYIANPKNPSGFLFGIKQNLLSRTSPKTESSFGAAYAAGALNEGIYTPLSTIAQAGVGFLGIHLNKQGIDPTGLISAISLRTYSNTLSTQIFTDTNFGEGMDKSTNRLVQYTNRQQDKVNISPFLTTYKGGPGSKLGIGKTNIRYATDNVGDSLRTGVNNPLVKTQKEYFYKGNIKLHKSDDDKIKLNYNTLFGASATSNSPLSLFPQSIDDEIGKFDQYQPSSAPISSSIKNNFIQLQTNSNHGTSPHTLDTKNLHSDYIKSIEQLVTASIGTRVNLGDPGASIGSKTEPLDKLNATKIYSTTSSNNGRFKEEYNDLVHFRIGIINPEKPTITTYMNFRAFIDSFSDSYNSSWKSQQYMGRGEKFYKYQDFERDISLAFTVVAQSQAEMNAMYQKLNTLASSLAPTYTSAGYMAGNLSKLTMGDYIYEQPGFISSLTYDIPDESPWEITYGTTGMPDELPFMIKVSGFKFTPIHEFRPEYNEGRINGKRGRFITHDLDIN